MSVRLLCEGILTSERVDTLSLPAEVFYRRLMSVVDNFGRFSAHPKLLRASCYPLRLDTVSDADVLQWLQECVDAALIVLYTVNDKPYLEFVNFKQRTRAKSGKCPPPPESDCGSWTHDAPMPDTCQTYDGQTRANARLDGDGINTLPGKPGDAGPHKSEIKTVEIETSEAESDDHAGKSLERAGKKARKPEAELDRGEGKKTAAVSVAAHELIHYLNEKSGRSYRLVAANVRLVQARLREGATVEQVKAVIDAKVRQWGHDPAMTEYLRPATLFGATKFEQYLGQLTANGTAAHRLVHDARCVN